jgi:ankyrin repeat domain-containing protein 50
MAEAFGVAANVAGVISLGLTVCQGLLNSYSAWKDAPDDVERMRESIKALNDAFKILNSFTMNEKFGSGIRDIVQQSITSCEGGLNRLQSKLDKIKVTPEGDKWSEKAKAQFRRSMYPFKQGTVEKFMMIANELRNNLSVALQALQM